MQRIISLGISPCPNDTYIFDAWVNSRLTQAPPVQCRLEDIETLNTMALRGELDVVKASFYAYGMLLDKYTLLNAGGALGRGCGPLIVARSRDITRQALAEPARKVAVPGTWTTAHLLFSLFQPEACNKVAMSFDRIMPAVARGEVDAGVVIHEGRFTFERHGLVMVEDLGAWWELTTGHPVPLGAILASKSFSDEQLTALENTIRRSIEFALRHPDAPLDFMRQHAGEMDPEVMRQHVALYVNRYSLSYGEDGIRAIDCLMEQAENAGLLRER